VAGLDELIKVYKNARLAEIHKLRQTVAMIREFSRHIKNLEDSRDELNRLTNFHRAAVSSLESAARVEIKEPVFNAALPPVIQVIEPEPDKFGAWVYDNRGNRKVITPAEKRVNQIILENCTCAVVKHPPCSWCESGNFVEEEE